MALRNLATPVNSTLISMNERFSSLQRQTVLTSPPGHVAIKPASARNRRLAEQLERRLQGSPSVRLNQRSVQQRLGVVSEDNLMRLRTINQRLGVRRGRGAVVVRGRGGARLARSVLMTEGITLVNRGRGRRRGRGGGGALRRTASIQSLQRSASLQSLTQIGRQSRPRSRSRSRSKMRMDRSTSRGSLNTPIVAPRRSRSRSRDVAQVNRGRSFSRARGGIGRKARSRGRTVQRGGAIGNQRGRSRSRSRNRLNIRGSGRGGIRGGRRGRGRRGGSNAPAPSKDELDKQLDQYMAGSRADADIKMDESWN